MSKIELVRILEALSRERLAILGILGIFTKTEIIYTKIEEITFFKNDSPNKLLALKFRQKITNF